MNCRNTLRTPAQAPIFKHRNFNTPALTFGPISGRGRGTIDWIDPCTECNGEPKAYRRGEGEGGGGGRMKVSMCECVGVRVHLILVEELAECVHGRCHGNNGRTRTNVSSSSCNGERAREREGERARSVGRSGGRWCCLLGGNPKPLPSSAPRE